jgi:uncharacterized membrane protein YcaP (DUF421 family)
MLFIVYCLGITQAGGTSMDLSFLGAMFVPGTSIIEKVLRPIIVYVFLIVGLRLSGKRELAQLNPFDFVVLLTLSNTVQNAIVGNDTSITGGCLGAAVLLLVNFLVVRFLFSHQKAELLLEGRPDVLIHRGTLIQKSLKRELITEAELENAARRQGFGSLEEVQEATIGPDGDISFTGKKPAVEEKRHQAILDKLAEIEKRLAQVRG